MERTLVYFISDVHLGLGTKDPAERESRFVSFLKSIPRDCTKAVYLMGDIWDFWYEYRDVIPREGIRVVSELIQLMDDGVEVFFFEGNHDIWCFSFFESIGMKKLTQPFHTKIGDRDFCLGHGDGVGGAKPGYKLMLKVFHCSWAQKLFSLLHPWLAFRIALGWSDSSRRSHEPYHFRGADEPLYKFAVSEATRQHTDFFIFGHFHDKVDLRLKNGERLIVIKDWMDGGTPHVLFDCRTGELSCEA